VSIAAFVLSLVAIVLAAMALTWQVVHFRGRGARPRLTAVIGLLTPEGLLTNDASRDVRDAMEHAAESFSGGPFVIGVKVVNAGRAPFHVTEWALRTDPDGNSLAPAAPPAADAVQLAEVPHDIAPGDSAIFAIELPHAHRFAEAAVRVEDLPARLVLTVSSGGRTYATKAVAPEVLSLGAP
jgi:hypothetical protein